MLKTGDIVIVQRPVGEPIEDGTIINVIDGKEYYFTEEMAQYIGKRTKVQNKYFDLPNAYILKDCGGFYFHESWLFVYSNDIIEDFKAGLVGFDLTNVTEEDIDNIVKLFYANDISVNDNIYDDADVKRYIKNSIAEKWTVMVYEGDYGLNCYRGDAADGYKKNHEVISFSKILGVELEITEDDWMAVFG